MNIDFSEELRVTTQEMVEKIDQQIAYLSEEYENFIKHVENETESLKRVKSLNHQMDSVVSNSLGVTVDGMADLKVKNEAALRKHKDELDSLKRVFEANKAVKNEKKANLSDMKSYVDSLKSKKVQLKNESANEALLGERFLMRHVGINFKISKDDKVVAVIYKNSTKKGKTVEKLITVAKENRDENEVNDDFWRSINRAVEHSEPIKKLTSIEQVDLIESVH